MTSPHGCLICGSPAAQVLYKSTASQEIVLNPRYYIPTYKERLLHGEISECKQCGFVFVSDRPSVNVYLNLYGEMNDATYLKEVEAYKASFRHALDQIRPYQSQGRALLEIGCGAGFFLREAQKEGWEISGVELSKWMVAQSEQVLGSKLVRQGSFEAEHPGHKDFDVVVAIHIIEHVADPILFLKTMKKRVKPGGILYLVTPNIESLIAKAMGEKWWYIQIPHIYYFSPKTINDFLLKNGFEVLKIQGYPRAMSKEILSNCSLKDPRT